MSITPLIFLLTFLAGLVASLATAGAWSFYLYQFVYFLFPPGRWWGAQLPDLPWSFMSSALLIFAVLIRSRQYTLNRLFAPPQTKWVVLLLLIYGIVLFFSIDPVLHRMATIDLLKLFVIIALAYKLLDTPNRLHLSVWVYLIGCAYIGWEAYSVGRNSMGRVEGIGTVDSPEANGTAAAIAPAVPLLVYFVWRSKNYLRFAAVFLSVWIVNGLVLINSRGAFLAVLGGTAYTMFYMLFSRRQEGGQRVFVLFVILAGLAGALYLTDSTFWERMSTLSDVEDESASGSHRTRMWMSAITLVQDYPLGAGVHGFQILSPQYVDPSLFFGGQTQKAVHSSWFQVLSEVGYAGAAFYLLMLAACFRATKKVKKHLFALNDSKEYFFVLAVEGALIAYLIAGTFIDQGRAQVQYWLIMYTACLYNIHMSRD